MKFNKKLLWNYDISESDLEREDVYILYVSRVLNNGTIDEVGFFNVALEAADIQILMDKGLKESINPSAVDLSGKLVAIWANIKAR